MLVIAFVFRIHTPDGDINPIYRWMTPGNDEIIHGKSAFLNPRFFAIFTICVIGLWSFFGLKFRQLSLQQDNARKGATKLYWTNVTFSGLFLLVYALTQMSTSPWMWVMSIDAHWYSTMFSWYSWASEIPREHGRVQMHIDTHYPHPRR